MTVADHPMFGTKMLMSFLVVDSAPASKGKGPGGKPKQLSGK